MLQRKRTIQQVIEEQAKRWQVNKQEGGKKEKTKINVVAVSRQPGSGGGLIARELSEQVDFDLFHQEVIHEMAKSGNILIPQIRSDGQVVVKIKQRDRAFPIRLPNGKKVF